MQSSGSSELYVFLQANKNNYYCWGKNFHMYFCYFWQDLLNIAIILFQTRSIKSPPLKDLKKIWINKLAFGYVYLTTGCDVSVYHTTSPFAQTIGVWEGKSKTPSTNPHRVVNSFKISDYRIIMAQTRGL